MSVPDDPAGGRTAAIAHMRRPPDANRIRRWMWCLTEPRFVLDNGKGNRFTGRVKGSTVTFELESDHPSR